MSIVPKETERKIKVCVFLNKHEIIDIKMLADHMFHQKLIPKSTVPAFLRAAGYKFYNEYNEMLQRQNAHSQRSSKTAKLLKYLADGEEQEINKVSKKAGINNHSKPLSSRYGGGNRISGHG